MFTTATWLTLAKKEGATHIAPAGSADFAFAYREASCGAGFDCKIFRVGSDGPQKAPWALINKIPDIAERIILPVREIIPPVREIMLAS